MSIEIAQAVYVFNGFDVKRGEIVSIHRTYEEAYKESTQLNEERLLFGITTVYLPYGKKAAIGRNVANFLSPPKITRDVIAGIIEGLHARSLDDPGDRKAVVDTICDTLGVSDND